MHVRANVTQPADPSYRLIALTRGQFAKVSTEDYECLMQFRWQAMWSPNGKCFKATRGEYRADGRTHVVYMHRDIMQVPKGVEVDHRNHDTLDNRRVNLRPATRAENNRNARRSAGASGHKGVTWHSQQRKWRVRIVRNGNRTSVGCFVNLHDALAAYVKAAHENYGEFACTETR